MSFPVTVGLKAGQEKVTSTAKIRTLGTRGVLPDGRVFYWAQAGGTALIAGDTIQTKVSHGASAHVAALDVVAAITTGVTTITVNVGTTNATANLYADGYLTIDTSPGQGMYQIKSHPAIASAAGGVFTLYEDDKLRDILTSGTTKVGLQENPYSSTVATPATTLTGIVVGVTPVAVPADSFFWLQTYGPAVVTVSAALVAGRGVIVAGASVGEATVQTTAAADIASQIIGYAKTAGAGADVYNYVFLAIRA